MQPGTHAAAAVPALSEQLKHPHATVREAAADALAASAALGVSPERLADLAATPIVARSGA